MEKVKPPRVEEGQLEPPPRVEEGQLEPPPRVEEGQLEPPRVGALVGHQRWI